MNNIYSNAFFTVAIMVVILATCYMAGKTDAREMVIKATQQERAQVICRERGYTVAQCKTIMGAR